MPISSKPVLPTPKSHRTDRSFNFLDYYSPSRALRPCPRPQRRLRRGIPHAPAPRLRDLQFYHLERGDVQFTSAGTEVHAFREE
jgi:hypothetical protein